MARAVKRFLPALLALLAISCATPTVPNRSLAGQWGGQHVGLVMGKASGRLAYDCAAGTIDQPLVTDSSGRFAATGTHTPGQGGPDRVGHVPPSYLARYSGSVRGDTMTLAVDVPALNTRIGPTTLRRDADPILLRCL